METITRKDRDGAWVTQTEIPLEGNQVLSLRTYRNSTHGVLATHANVAKREGDFMVTRLFQDFSEVVAKEPCARATAKVCEAQHQAVLSNLDDLKAKISTYYAEKAQKEAANG